MIDGKVRPTLIVTILLSLIWTQKEPFPEPYSTFQIPFVAGVFSLGNQGTLIVGKDQAIWRFGPSGEILGQNQLSETVHQIWQMNSEYWASTDLWIIRFNDQDQEIERYRTNLPVASLTPYGSGYILEIGQMISWLNDGRIQQSRFLDQPIKKVWRLHHGYLVQSGAKPPQIWHPNAPKVLRNIHEIHSAISSYTRLADTEIYCTVSGDVIFRKKGKTKWVRPVGSEIVNEPQIIEWGKKQAIVLATKSRNLSVLGTQGQELLHLRLEDRPTQLVRFNEGCMISLVSLKKLLYFDPQGQKIFRKTLPSHIVKTHSTLNWVAFLGYDRSVTLFQNQIPEKE